MIKNKSVVFLSYVLSLIAALTIGTPFYHLLSENFSTSIVPNALAKDFDLMIFSDVFRQISENISEIVFPAFILFWIALIASTFLSGGFVDALQNEKLKFQRFFIFSLRYWKKNFLLACLLSLLLIISILIIALLIYAGTKWVEYPNFRENLFRFIPATVFMCLSFMYLFLCWDYGRNILLKKQPITVFKTFLLSNKVIFGNLNVIKTFGLVLFLSIALFTFYLWIIDLFELSSTFGIIIMFLTQQVFVFLRKYLRLYHLKRAGGLIA